MSKYRYKLIYNRKRKWYPGTNVVQHTFATKKGAIQAQRKIIKGKSYPDPDIKKAEIIRYKPKKRKI